MKQLMSTADRQRAAELMVLAAERGEWETALKLRRMLWRDAAKAAMKRG